MHELSLASGLIDQLQLLATEHRAKKITKATVVIGPFSGIVADSFSFGFDALKQEQELTAEASLIIEQPAPEFSCLHCGKIFSQQQSGDAAASRIFAGTPCPHCGSHHCTAKGGDELILKQLEME